MTTATACPILVDVLAPLRAFTPAWHAKRRRLSMALAPDGSWQGLIGSVVVATHRHSGPVAEALLKAITAEPVSALYYEGPETGCETAVCLDVYIGDEDCRRIEIAVLAA